MPKEWYLMNRPLFNSGYESDEFSAFAEDGFREVLESFLGKDVQIYDTAIYKDPINARVVIQNVTTDSTQKAYERQILTEIGVLKCGQYIRYENAWWIVATHPDNNGMYEKAILWKCRYTLKFISPKSGKIVEYPVFDINSTQYGTGEAAKKQITIGNSEHLVYIPYNDETIIFDNGFRMLMDRNKNNPTAYRITQVDTTSWSDEGGDDGGLLQWTVIETPFNEETDNKELMIADYYKVKSASFSERESVASGKTEPEIGVLRIVDLDNDQKLAIGEAKELIVVCTDKDAGEVRIRDFSVISDIDSEIANISVSDGKIIVSAAKDRRNVGKTINIEVSTEKSDEIAAIPIRITSW